MAFRREISGTRRLLASRRWRNNLPSSVAVRAECRDFCRASSVAICASSSLRRRLSSSSAAVSSATCACRAWTVSSADSCRSSASSWRSNSRSRRYSACWRAECWIASRRVIWSRMIPSSCSRLRNARKLSFTGWMSTSPAGRMYWRQNSLKLRRNVNDIAAGKR